MPHGISISKVTWFEDEESGKTIRRDALEKMQEAIFDGNIKKVIV